MQYITLVLLTVILSVSHFTERPKILPPIMNFLPEVLAGLVLVYVIFVGAKSRFRNVRAEYWLAFGTLAIVMTCGIFANAVAPGPIFAGIRSYARAIPLFFLPAVYLYTPKQLRQQFRWIAFISLIQLPLAVRERMSVIDAGRWSGDSVVGTLEDSSCLSIFLISTACVITAMTVRGLMSRRIYFSMLVILLLPTTVNETKATLILMPPGLLLTMLVASPPARRLRVFGLASVLLITFFAIFAPIYDYLERHNPYRVPITSFFTDPENFMRYVGGKADVGGQHVGRLDGIKVPMRYLAKEPSELAFGLGIGNASHSNLGEQFTGQYYLMFQKFLLSCLTSFLLEIGVLGTGLVFVLYWLIFRDSLVVARLDPGFMGAFAAAWSGVVAMTALAMPYKTLYVFPSMSFLFWYMSGLVAARRMILTRSDGDTSIQNGRIAVQAAPKPREAPLHQVIHQDRRRDGQGKSPDGLRDRARRDQVSERL